MQVTRWLPLAAMLALPVRSAAQAPAYTAGALECARFSETVRGTLESAFGTVRRTEAVGRDGILVVRATPDSAGLVLEAWYDTLAVFREGPEGRFMPEAAGLLGGRYLGILDPDGDYLASATPFVPVGVRDVFDFGRVLLHFFPPLPATALRPGAEWTDHAGLTIWRLADSAATPGPVSRYRWIRRAGWDEGLASGDSSIVVHRSEREDGSLTWGPGSGPRGWSQSLVARVEYANGAGRSVLSQESHVRRLEGACP